MTRPKPLVLIILDGWGYRAETKANAIAMARKPTYDRLLREYPNTLIQTSGPFVGLPEGQMGNSEVGHLNIGAGRVVQMDITRIDHAISSGAFFKEKLLLDAMERGQRHRISAAVAAKVTRIGRGPHRLAVRALLRNGSRQPLGAHRARLSRRGA